MSGIYVHIPFCKQACHYCNFHFSTSLKYEDRMIDAICKELELRVKYLGDSTLETIYFGGGTPSVISLHSLSLILKTIQKHYNISDEAEVTLEANPDDISLEKLKGWKELGVNRLSVGIQSFSDNELQWMNRAHTTNESLQTLTWLTTDEQLEFSADLIFGVPGSDSKSWKRNVDQLLEFSPAHISSYALTVEENTALYKKIKNKSSQAPADQALHEQFYMTHDILEKHGYDHYEISNYAQDGKYARHNTNYWKSKPYLGIGPSAHSYNVTSRSWNVANNAMYMDAIEKQLIPLETEELSKSDIYNEFLLTRLRTKWGFSLKDLNDQFGSAYKNQFLDLSKQFSDQGKIIEQDGQYFLSKEALIISDQLISDLFFIDE